MFDSKTIIQSIRRTCDKDSKAYKMTVYYLDLINGSLDEGGVTLVTSKVLNIEKELKKWAAKHPNNETTIMQLEENVLILIEDLRKRDILK
jgi:hypothetical protein